MANDPQSRKWQITINNPLEKGFDHEKIKDTLNKFSGMLYWCMSDEVGLEERTPHTHIFMALGSATRFSTIKNRFPGAHIEMANGTSAENRDYIFKIGKYEKDRKKETNIEDSHEEFGELPQERQGARNDLADLYDMIKSGMSNYEILECAPQYLFSVDKLERARQVVKEKEYANKWRDLVVTYVFGKSGLGKTRSVMDMYGYENVYRVTDYMHPFDNYQGQEVIVFDEFRSQLSIVEMLNYLDGYPIMLPCRYSNKPACFTKVYIISNIGLEEQYTSTQREQYETWKAFTRRIEKVIQYTDKGIIPYATSNYLATYREHFVECHYSPFDKNK